MVDLVEEGKEVLGFLIRKSVGDKDWSKVDKLCSENKNLLSDSETDYWIRSKFMIGEYDDCVEISDKVLSETPGKIVAMKFGARARTKLRMAPSEVRGSWEEFLLQEPDNLEAMNNIARALIEEGEISQASEKITNLLELNSDYGPALTTLKKLRNVAADSATTDIDYRNLYSERRFSEVLQLLGFPTNADNWSEDEGTFALRSLARMGRFRELLEIYGLLNATNRKSPRILAELASSARELGEGEIENDSISKLSEMGKSDKSAARHYLRQIVYFEEDETLASSIIEDILEIHGEEVMSYLVRLILKSKRSALFSVIDSFGGVSESKEYSLKSLFDPFNGKLKESIGNNEFNSLYSDLNKNISQALKNDHSQYRASMDSYFFSCDELDLPYLIPGAYQSDSPLLKGDKLELGHFSGEELDNYCSAVSEYSFDYDSIGPKSKSSIYCSRFLFHPLSDVEGEASILYIGDGEVPTGVMAKIIDGEIVSSEEKSILIDPREILGRFYHLLAGMREIDKLVISWISSIIYNYPPEIVYYDTSLNHGRIAATMLGYGGGELRELGVRPNLL